MTRDSYKDRVAIICGSAPCVKDEFEIVSKSYPNAIIIGINEAVWHIHCHLLMTCHVNEVDHFLDGSKNKEIEVHTSKYYPDYVNKYPEYNFWEGIKGGATSAIDAVQICQRMDFKEIILVGCPMNGGDGYFYGEKAKENVEGCPRFGNPENDFLANKHKNKLLQIVKEGNFDNVSSFSGFTSEVFGKPKI